MYYVVEHIAPEYPAGDLIFIERDIVSIIQSLHVGNLTYPST
jgi:hypothetical protein